jgi:hypothetical protein
MSYFRELPDLEYQSPLSHRKSDLEYVRAKNLFRRVKLRDDLQNVFTVFNKYQVPDGARPDTVAEEVYGRSDYDWVVLLSANIINVRDQWPLSNHDLYNFVEDKYGIEGVNEIKFYETTEVRDSSGRLILPAGKIVDKNFVIYDPDEVQSIVGSGTTVSVIQTLNPVVGVTNYEYEVRKNTEKRSIYILRPEYLQQYVNDLRAIMYYDKSSQFVDKKLIRTENTRVTSPQ